MFLKKTHTSSDHYKKDEYFQTATYIINSSVIIISLIALTALYLVPGSENIQTKGIFSKEVSLICFILSACALFLKNSIKSKNYILGNILAIIVLLISISVLVEHLLFDLAQTNTSRLYIGLEMSSMTTINFILYTISLLTFYKNEDATRCQMVALLILFVSFFGLMGHLYNFGASYFLQEEYIYPSILSIFNFLLLTGALFLSAPHSGLTTFIFERSIGGRIIRRLLPYILTIPLIWSLLNMFLARSSIFQNDFTNAILIYGTAYLLTLIAISYAKRLNKIDHERKIMQKKLEESESLFIEFGKNMDIVLWKTSIDLQNIIYVSPAFERIWGISIEELYKHPFLWQEAIVPEDREKVRETFLKKIYETNSIVAIEFRIKRPDGIYRWILAQGFLLKNARGEGLYSLGISSDITAYKTNTQLLTMEKSISSVLESEKDIKFIATTVLKNISKSLGWDYAEFWLKHPTKPELYCIEVWHIQNQEIELFAQNSLGLSFKADEGVTGEIWRSHESVWSASLDELDKFTRKDEAEAANLHSIMGIPIIWLNKGLGVINFYSQHIKEPEQEWIVFLENIGKRIGQFIQFKYTQKEVEYTVQHNILTHLLNRSTLENKLDTLITTSPTPLALIIFDIDRFKLVNEVLGHEAGDMALQAVSVELKKILHDTDLAASVGDKFIVAFFNPRDNEEVVKFINQILSIFKKPYWILEKELFMTISIGIAMFPHDADNSKMLLNSADLALNQAKKIGRNTFQFFRSDIGQTSSDVFEIQTELTHALEKNEFVLYFQPKLDLSTNKICGVEALIRWQHPEMGLLSPGYFVTIAEENGMIIDISNWVFKEVASEISRGWFDIPISINLSSLQFKSHHKLVSHLQNSFLDKGIDANLIELEITESIILEATKNNLQILFELKDKGFRLSIDDFGTGFSSLAYLQRIPADTIKIDQSFIRGLPDNTNNATIVKLIITLFHSLGKKVIAEGVETSEELYFLQQNECDEIQGYYFSRPLPAEDIRNFIKNHIEQAGEDFNDDYSKG